MSAQKFMCKICGERIAVTKALIKGYLVIIVGKCPRRHTNKFYLQYNNRDNWIDDLRISIHKCICGLDLRRDQVLPRGHYVLVLLNCPTHGAIKRTISTPIWNAMESVTMNSPPVNKTMETSRNYGPEVIIPPSKSSEVNNSSTGGSSNWSTTIASKKVETSERSKNIKFCPSCGDEIIPGSFFCTNCGEELK